MQAYSCWRVCPKIEYFRNSEQPKLPLQFSKWAKNEDYWQKRTLWYTNVLDHKMRTIYSWKAVEHILEMRKIEGSYHRVGVVHYVQFWNPYPLFVQLESLKRMICIQSGAWVPVKNISPLNLVISTLPHFNFQNGMVWFSYLSHLQNGLNYLPGIISFNTKNVRIP